MKINLPKNMPMKHDIGEQMAVWVMGDAGVGKTTFATTWPNAFMINTDGNYKHFQTPSVFVDETMIVNNKPVPGFEYIEALVESFIQQKGTKGGYQTLVIDLIEDVVMLADKMIAEQHQKKYCQEIPWGKGYKILNETLTRFFSRLNATGMNVIYLSHSIEANTKDINGNDIVKLVPKNFRQDIMTTLSGRVQLACLLEIVDVEPTDDDPTEKLRILNWEKSVRLPHCVSRYNTLETYSLATYEDLRETLLESE